MYPPQGISALLEEALVVYKGTTTSAGADASELVCSDLASKADWDGNQIIITSGDYEGQARDINGATNNATGTVTPANAFGGVIVAGVTFVITGIRTVPAEVAACLAILESDSRRILSTALTPPTVNSLTRYIASGGTALGTPLPASKSLYNILGTGYKHDGGNFTHSIRKHLRLGLAGQDATNVLAEDKSLIDAIGADGNDALSHDFSEAGIMQYLHGTHETSYTLFIIPEAVASISTHNTAIKTSLEKLGRVIVITQADALTYPDFNTYTLCVLGSNNGTAWTTSNLAHIKDITEVPIVCCDSVSAAYLEMGTANANVTSTKALFGVANIEGSIVGAGLHGRTGLAVGAQDIADATTTFASLDMSDADITEVYYGYETSDDNAHVLLGKIRFIQPDGTIGVDEEGEEIHGSRYFYGPAYSFNDLNTLGQDVFEILVLGFIHSRTIGHSIAISGEIRSLEKVLFGNLKNKFSNSNPLAKYIGTGGVGLGQPLPDSTSLVDLFGDFTGPYNGGDQDDNVKASLDLAHTDLDSIIADIGTVDGYHDVPGEDAAGDAQMRDVIGKKTDTVAGTSVVSISKQVKAKTDNLPTDPADESQLEAAITTAHTATDADIATVDGKVATAITDIAAAEAKVDTAITDIGTVDGNVDTINTNTDTKVAGKLQIAITTEDLNQTAGAKDLLTGTAQSVILEKLTIRMPTEAASAPLTSISIQTDDVTPSVIINSTDGAVANLTSEAQLSWTGAIEIPVGTKIQLTIAGGAHGSTYTTTIVAQCRAVVAGGYLA